MSHGFPMIGNLATLPQNELDKTNNSIRAMLAQRQKDLEYRKNIEPYLKSLEEENTKNTRKIEETEKQIYDNEKQIENLKAQLEGCEERQKREKERLISEKDEWIKKFNLIVSQQAQYVNEVRKKDQEIKKFQDQVFLQEILKKKLKIDKGLKYKNSIEISKTLKNTNLATPTINMKSNEFLMLITKGYEESLRELQTQIQNMKDSFKIIQEELLQISDSKKSIFVFFLFARFLKVKKISTKRK